MLSMSSKASTKAGNPKLDNLLAEFYNAKRRSREFTKLHKGVTQERRNLMEQKDQLLFEIKKELNSISKAQAERVRKRLWKDLRVVV